jgi:hypothetical protein
MSPSIEKMRDDFNRLAEARVRAGHWSEADVAEANAAIKAAIGANDAVQIQCWADWLAESAEFVRKYRAPLIRGCATCRSRTEFTRTGADACKARRDLPPHSTPAYPLRKLPADLGASCSSWGAR